ncbi:CoA pyrophosphatase [Oceanisphaera profunda]|uniref:CoA pyrophosphatase n=1 Tax=Oceanisphaera profunda TaxID=1416627 RepID=A0A1Y0D9H7_9GAMM|nr:CoA pyrophosphatase [Oceanisphaera profunda]ART83776.1 CoA pyrophosphatase [Oceanisphaera profunda]
MTLDELKTRINLLTPGLDPHLPSHAFPAAVLMPLLQTGQGLELVLTRRSRHLRHHPGQVSFPGGRADATDTSLWHTALRESWEEIGLLPELCQPLAQLQAQHTISGFALTPFIGLIEGHPQFKLNPAEVDELFQVPLDYLLDLRHHHLYQLRRQGRTHEVVFIRWQGLWIWGITATVIHQFAQQIAR